MHPLAFGYIRLPAGASEQSAQDLRRDLADYADRQGYALAEVFAEHESFGSSAFAALIDALKRSRTSIVIVPSLCHFAHLPGLRSAMRDLIEQQTDARVFLTAESARTGSRKAARPGVDTQ